MEGEVGRLSPKEKGERKRKLPQVDSSPGVLHESRDSPERIRNVSRMSENEHASPDGASIAYISETLITQITKEQRLDLVKSLTIHLPKDKLNKKIKYIENLEKLKRLQSLNLSNNVIEKIQKLESLVELRELNLANNYIHVIEGVGGLVKLQTLNLSGNLITSIPGPIMKKLRCLKHLKLAHNKLETLLDITKLRCLQDLTNLDLQGNPFSTLPHYREFVIFQLRSLDVLDNQAVTKEERVQADERFAQEDVRRLEVELSKQEKRSEQLEMEKNEAQKTIEHLTKTKNSLKAKETRQTEKINELEHDIDAKNGLLKAKNSDLIKASENQYRLEQELAFYKLDAKFEMLGELPLLSDDTQEVDEDHGLNDSAYIGKATYKRNAFSREGYVADGAQLAEMQSMRMKHEDDVKRQDDLDQEILEKKATILRLHEQLKRLSDDVCDKNEELQNLSERLVSLEMDMARQMNNYEQGNELARKRLAEKIEFIKRLQGAARELEERMKSVAGDVATKQNELDALRSDEQRTGAETEALKLKEAELAEAFDELSKMREHLEMLKHRIAEEQTQVEALQKQLGQGVGMSEEAVEELKKELESVVEELHDRQEQQDNIAREQQERIGDLENERDILLEKLAKAKETKEQIKGLQNQLDAAADALRNERERSRTLEERERGLRDQLAAQDKNDKLGLMEAQAKLKQLGQENKKLQEMIKQLKNQIENERESARGRVERDEGRIAKALEAARLVADKDNDIKGLLLQLDALKATNEALNDRLEDAENELARKEKDCVEKDTLLQQLNDLLNDMRSGEDKIREPVDQSDGIGHRLADLHREYLDLARELKGEQQKGKLKEKQAKEAVDNLQTQLAQVTSQLNAAEEGLAQLSHESALHDSDMRNLEDDIYRLQKNLRAALDKLEHEKTLRAREKEAYEEKIRALKEKLKRLQNERQDGLDQRDRELGQLRGLAKKQKDRFDKEMRLLQDELQKLRDQHLNELLNKDGEIERLEAQHSEDEKHFMEYKNKRKDDIQNELKQLRRLVAEKTKATEDAINQKRGRKKGQRDLESDVRKMDQNMASAQNNIHDLEKLLDAKEKQIHGLKERGLELEHNVTALSQELEDLKRSLSNRERYFPQSTRTVHRIRERSREEDDAVSPQVIRHDIHTHPVNHDVYQTIHHLHHYDNSSTPLQRTLTTEHHVSRAPAAADVTSPSADQVHYHRHYGNGDFTQNLKKNKKPKKKDFCNVSEHDELVDDVIDLEEELAVSNSKLSSQTTENKLNALRSDLKELEHTVFESSRHNRTSQSLDSRLGETIAKFQDHLMTIMDHRTTLSSPDKI